VADFGELTLDTMINWSGGKGGRLFDFGTSEEECFYLSIDGGGKPTLTARHQGKTYTVTASENIPANKWVRVRVAMDGSTAAIHIDGKQAAKQGFAFSPRMVFSGDRPEGNFIACGRNQDEYFKGRMDHFRIYRKVHGDFDTLGPTPYALTQIQEWSEKDQVRADEWDGRRKAKDAELSAGEYGKMQEELKRLREGRSTLLKTAKPDVLAKFDARIAKLQNESMVLRENALKNARLSGSNPYPGKNAAELGKLQQSLKYHTTADWDYSVQGDGRQEQGESEIPPKMKEWLLRVRGY
jgi:hypothetical protein